MTFYEMVKIYATINNKTTEEMYYMEKEHGIEGFVSRITKGIPPSMKWLYA